jgi:DNA-binding transcriptional ArsR family regulator
MASPDHDDFDTWADWFKCLADPTRLRVLQFVSSQNDPVTVGEIVDHIGQSQSNVSRHIGILAEQRFVFTEPEGVRTMVRVNELCMVELPDAIAAIMNLPASPG